MLCKCVCVCVCVCTTGSPSHAVPPADETAKRWRVEESVEGRGAMYTRGWNRFLSISLKGRGGGEEEEQEM